MANRNWNLITSGATFEALATTLLFFEDPQAALFGRRGKDGGQDVRSGDGTRVFQAKHHEDDSAAKAIADAKKEVAKIAEYRKPEHARSAQWKRVTHWRLVTNASFNPTDEQRWATEVVPLFTAQGLSADYWARTHLDALLTEYPWVDRSFFQNETRVFLSLPELREYLPSQDPFLQRPALTAFFGRTNEIAQVRDFLMSDELFLVVHGAGGIGKTRLLVEAGEEIAGEGAWQVLWANVASMASTGTWFQAIVPERPTLLLVDEPEDEQLLRILSEQLGKHVGRAAKWKVAVTVRSPKDPVLQFLSAPRMKLRVQELPITALSEADAESMCSDLLNSGPLAQRTEEWRKDAARELARRFERHPVWLTLAVHVLETQGDLTKVPQNAEGLANCYLDEIVRHQQRASSDQVLALLRWVVLIGTVNRADDTTVRLLGKGSGIGDETAVRKMLASLVERRALIQRGKENQLVEVKPDVLRDHLLLNWLSVDIGYGAVPVQPSEDAKALVASVLEAVLKGNISSIGRSILISLAWTELLLRLSGRPVPLLDPFFTGIRDALQGTTAGPRLVIAEVLLDVAAFRPSDTVALICDLRSSIVSSETIEGLFRSREVGQDDVTLALAWPVFHAAMGAQTPRERAQVLEELCVLTEVEAEIATRRPGGLPNDGKRAADLIGRTLGGGPQFWGDFEEAACALAARLLERAASEPATPPLAAVLQALLEPALALTRHQIWVEDYIVYEQSSAILPGHPAWQTRVLLLARVKDLLADSHVPLPSRLVLWPLFAEAHRSVNQCRGQVPKHFQEQLRQQLLDDLVWARAILTTRKVELEELTAARALWDWHYRFDKDPVLKAESEALESLYASDDLASEFEPLFGYDTLDQRDQHAAAKAAVLADGQTSEAIGAFIDRAMRFLGGEHKLSYLHGVAWYLGQHASTKEIVGNFVRTSLAAAEMYPHTDFAAIAAASWVATLRNSNTPMAAYDLVVELVKICGSDEKRMYLLQKLYGASLSSSDINKLTAIEHDHLRSLAPLFVKNGQVPVFIQAVAWTLHYNWPALKALLDTVLNSVAHGQISLAVTSLVNAVARAIRELDPTALPSGLAVWLLDQLLRIPDLDSVGNDLHWHVEWILKRIGRAPLSWLPKALIQRRDMETQSVSKKVRAVSFHVPFSHYVTPISAMHVGDPEVEKAVEALIDLVRARGTVGHHLPKFLHDVDPEGLLIPDAVIRRFADVTSAEDLWLLAGIGRVYAVGSAAWRTIAKLVIVRAVHTCSEEERCSLFHSLTDPGPLSVRAVGEVAQIFITAVEFARQRLESETDTEFRPFWKWYLTAAEAELHEQEEHAKEERGE
jgi:hypothetical protein